MIKKRITFESIYMYSFFLWSFVYALINESMAKGLFGPESFRVYGVSWLLIRSALIVVFAFYPKNVKEYILYGALLLVGLISTNQSGSSFLEAFFWFMSTAKGMNWKKIIKMLFLAQLYLMILVVSLSLLGVVENVTVLREETGAQRYSFGYLNPNSLSTRTVQLTLLAVVYNFKKLKAKHLLYVLAVGLLMYKLTDSNTAFYCLVFFDGLLALYLLSNQRIPFVSKFSKWGVKLVKYIIFLTIGMSIYAAVAFDKISFMSAIKSNKTFYSRFTQINMYFKTYSIKPFGQTLYYHAGESGNSIPGLYTLDNSYIYLLLGFGIVVFVLFFYLYILAIYKSIKNKRYEILIVLAVYALYGFTETALIRFSYNFSLIFLFPSMWIDSDVFGGKRLTSFSDVFVYKKGRV